MNFNNSLALYVHLPWCLQKCPYCDFNSYPKQNIIPEKKYLKTLINDLNEMIELTSKKNLLSIYFGGGTPSLFSPSFFEQLLTYLHNHFSFSHNIEISLEANPHTVDSNNFIDYAAIGINRLSLGIQTFNNDCLKYLGRTYSHKEIFNAIDIVQKANFSSYSFDIMYGIPQQTPIQALCDLNTAINFDPKHISWYQLTIEPNTSFAKQKITPLNDDIVAHIETEGLALLKNKAYSRYEISAYCKPTNECQHNLNYWNYGDYIGIGAGAHSKLTMGNKIIRYAKTENPEKYMSIHQSRIASQTKISKELACFEFMLNSLRLLSPIEIRLFEHQTKAKYNDFSHLFAKAINENLLNANDQVFWPTELGKKFLNDLILIFLPTN